MLAGGSVMQTVGCTPTYRVWTPVFRLLIPCMLFTVVRFDGQVGLHYLLSQDSPGSFLGPFLLWEREYIRVSNDSSWSHSCRQ